MSRAILLWIWIWIWIRDNGKKYGVSRVNVELGIYMFVYIEFVLSKVMEIIIATLLYVLDFLKLIYLAVLEGWNCLDSVMWMGMYIYIVVVNS